ncbi:MAG: WG repeat-containing protein [Cytophagaceae bacterium]
MALHEGLAVQKKTVGSETYFGFVDSKGQMKISFEYDTIFKPFHKGLAIVGKHGLAGVIDKKNKVIVPFEYIAVHDIYKTVIPVEGPSRKWGFYNTNGQRITECIFDNFSIKEKDQIMVQKLGKWGIIDTEGKTLVDFNYRGMGYISFRKYYGIQVNTWYVKNLKNEIIKSFEFDSLRLASEKVYVYALVGKLGLVTTEGNTLSGPDFEEISDFRNGLAVVKKRDQMGAIDAAAKTIIPPVYRQVIMDSLYVRVQLPNGKWGLMDYKGAELIKPKFLEMDKFSNGLIAVKYENGTWGYVAPSGEVLILSRFSQAGPFSKESIALVKIPYSAIDKELPAIINKNGDYVVRPDEYEDYRKGIIRVANQKARYVIPKDKYTDFRRIDEKYIRVYRNGKQGIVTESGTEFIPPIYDSVSAPSKDGFVVVKDMDRYGVIGPDGQFTLRYPNKYEKIYGFEEGYSRFLLKGKYGFLDPLNNVFISPQYAEAENFHEGLVALPIRGKWGFMNKDERLVVQPRYDAVKPFRNGFALVTVNGKWNFVMKDGKEIYEDSLDMITELKSGRFLLMRSGRYGLADKNGREVISVKYDKVEDLDNGYVKVQRNGLWGMLDYKENIIIPVENDILRYYPEYGRVLTVKKGQREEISVK